MPARAVIGWFRWAPRARNVYGASARELYLLAATSISHDFDGGKDKYASVDRYDNKQYRELYTSPAAVKAVREGKPIPDGTVIAMAIHSAKLDDKGAPVKDASGRFVKDKLTGVTVMEKRKGFGESVPEE